MARDKQKLFAEEYIVDFNATQAAIRAGYSEKTAHSIGSENLKKPAIQELISRAIQDRIRRTHITQKRVVLELASVAFADMTKQEESGLAWKDKLRALELLGKHLGMFDSKAGERDVGETGVAILPEIGGE